MIEVSVTGLFVFLIGIFLYWIKIVDITSWL